MEGKRILGIDPGSGKREVLFRWLCRSVAAHSVERAVDIFEVRVRHMGIDLGRCHVFMSQKRLDRAQVGSVHQ